MELISTTSVGTGFWLVVAIACLMGAMSPGPSLVVVVNHSLSRGPIAGIFASISHGLGIGLYALITAFGIAEIIQRNSQLYILVQLIGCIFLIFMAIKLIFKKKISSSDELSLPSVSTNLLAARDGFLIAILNPKILIFFTALFSQFVGTESSYIEKLYLVLIAGGIDAFWYILVAITISRAVTFSRATNISTWLDKLFGLFLISIAILFIVQLVSNLSLTLMN